MSDEKKKGPADGGKARWEGTSAKERSEAARKMAAARWTADLPKATHGDSDHPLRIGGLEIGCYVLDDGRRVISQRGLQAGICISESGGAHRLLNLVGSLSDKGVDCKDLRSRIEVPIKFVTPGGPVGHGYEATALADMCDVILDARRAGVLLSQQQHIADACEVLVRSFARVGIIALVDEATGYQKDRARDALAKILEAFIAKELRPYVKTFDPDFYEEMCRLRKVPFDGKSKKPQYFGHLTNDLVYARLAPGVLKELQEKNPAVNGRRKVKHFQYLTENHGHPKLTKHLGAVTALMSVSKTWEDFYKLLEKHKPKQIEYPLYDGLDQDGDAG